MDRRSFILTGTAAAVHASGVLGWSGGAATVELGSIDGSVGGNQFTPAQFLDYLSSIKLTWAMISLPPPVLGDEAAVRQIRAHADRLGIKLQLAFGSVCPSSRSFNAQLGTLEEQVATLTVTPPSGPIATVAPSAFPDFGSPPARSDAVCASVM